MTTLAAPILSRFRSAVTFQMAMLATVPTSWNLGADRTTGNPFSSADNRWTCSESSQNLKSIPDTVLLSVLSVVSQWADVETVLLAQCCNSCF